MDPVEPVSRARPAVAPVPPLRPPARRRRGEGDEDQDEAQRERRPRGDDDGDSDGDDRPHVDVLA
jgi:hypothetical protein